MAFEVRVYKPNKDGKLEYDRKLSPDEISTIHWDKFNRDNKFALNYAERTAYSRIKIDVRECGEPDCKNIIEDSKSITCSPACKLQRIRRKRRESTQRYRAKGNK